MTKKKTEAIWTVMVLMGAHNLQNEADLTESADADLREMQSIGSIPGVLDIVVQIHRKSGVGRFHIEKNKKRSVDSTPAVEGTSGDPIVLEGFLQWAKESYPARHYLLVLWGHAYELAFNREGRDALDFPKLSAVLRRTNNGKKLDIVGFDSCAMSMVEGAYQLRDVADLMVAPQVIDPLPGWPYDCILERIRRDPKHMTPDDLGRAIVSQFVRNFRGAGVTMTLLDVARTSEIGRAVGELSNELARAVTDDAQELAQVKILFQNSRVATGEPHIDLLAFCWQLSQFSGYEAVRQGAGRLGDLLINPHQPFVLEHGRSDFNVAMLNGVSIFAPNIEGGLDPAVRPRYESLQLSKDTRWGDLVFALAEPD